MSRSTTGLLCGVVIGVLWAAFGIGNLIIIALVGLIGYTIAALTGSSDDLEQFRNKLNRFFNQKAH